MRYITLHAETGLTTQMKRPEVGFLPASAHPPYKFCHYETGLFRVSWPGGESVYNLGARAEVRT